MKDVVIPSLHGKDHSEPVHDEPKLKVHQHSKHVDEEFLEVEKALRITCIAGLVTYFVAVIVLSVLTQSSLFNTMLGLSPLLFTMVVTYILVDRYHMESGFLMVFPFIFTGILLLLGAAGLLGGIDYLTLASVNIILGLLFEAVLVMHYSAIHKQHHHEEPVKEEQVLINLDDEESVKKLVSSIEDKAKAINAVIGRVYGVRKGGTESLRKKIRLDPAHYNEFSMLKDKSKRKEAATSLVFKIKERLELLAKMEREVFTSQELERLVRLMRDEKGGDAIIDILAKNDSDPVRQYYDGALEFCDNTLKGLGVSPHTNKYKGLEGLEIS